MQMYKLMNAARGECRKAIQSRQLAVLDPVIAKASSLPFEFKELKEAKKLQKYLQVPRPMLFISRFHVFKSYF